MNTVPVKTVNNADKPAGAILQTLAYFDIFQYPLLKIEIKSFLSQKISDEALEAALKPLVYSGAVFEIDQFYSLKNDLEIIHKRQKGNFLAKNLLPKATKIGSFLYRFPYVRAVAISGSLSKNYVEEKADIDFFIITKKDRLWIARTFMHLFKKLTFLAGKQHLYCMNFYIDEDSLLISEKNIYTATEIITLLPVAGRASLKDFFEFNAWAGEWFPNYSYVPLAGIYNKNSRLKKLVERIFNKRGGDRFDNFLFKWTNRRWQKKEERGDKNVKGRTMNLVAGKHFAKSNPGSFQENIIAIYNQKITMLKDKWPQYFD